MDIQLQEKNMQAKNDIMAELREKYKNRIDAERSKMDREKKFAESLDGGDPADAIIAAHRERINNRELVKVRLDKKTTIYVDRNKCEQQEDGTWIKKEK